MFRSIYRILLCKLTDIFSNAPAANARQKFPAGAGCQILAELDYVVIHYIRYVLSVLYLFPIVLPLIPYTYVDSRLAHSCTLNIALLCTYILIVMFLFTLSVRDVVRCSLDGMNVIEMKS